MKRSKLAVQRGEYEYEIHFTGQAPDETSWVLRSQLQQEGLHQMLRQCDDRESFREAAPRTATRGAALAQIGELGLDEEYAGHIQILGLSGGQRVKLVLAAALWGAPHAIILDEPTNYLDRDALAALALAIQEFQGGVVLVSHNTKFVQHVSREILVLGGGTIRKDGEDEPPEGAAAEGSAAVVEEVADIEEWEREQRAPLETTPSSKVVAEPELLLSPCSQAMVREGAEAARRRSQGLAPSASPHLSPTTAAPETVADWEAATAGTRGRRASWESQRLLQSDFLDSGTSARTILLSAQSAVHNSTADLSDSPMSPAQRIKQDRDRRGSIAGENDLAEIIGTAAATGTFMPHRRLVELGVLQCGLGLSVGLDSSIGVQGKTVNAQSRIVSTPL